ncbi:hypothetical protein BJF79_40760 [Actinomadura sp. CNU-125]|uniref:DUF6406 domain-containing protein n=1 Tax=Actinomadura sp. CNU-125 TaxID=1904961 RepID=UPI000964816C|nr:DUF6406 domain-containing protein [Actinomadura sp. CNU-125]OLT29522.1 hypothetical protein BJF79_40760 [Actinomadura sp. CNU-125]
MAVHNVVLQRNMQRQTEYARFMAPHARDTGDPRGPEVTLVTVVNGDENRHVLHRGDRFSVGEETWQVDRAELIGDTDWAVYLNRVA